jgi:hypothetical protein
LSPIDKLGGLFSHDPSVPVGLFPFPFDSDPGPSSQFGTGLFSAGSPAASGWAASLLAPLGPLQDPFAGGNPTQDNSRGLSSGPTDSATTPMASPQSVLFNRPQPNWDLNSALIARDRDAAALDAVAQGLGAGGLPRSKSGAPYDAPSVAPAPLLSFEPPQWLDAAHFLSPNLVDYFTKTLPPAPLFPSTPGKIPSTDNPYAPGAAIEAVAWLAAALERAMAAPLVGAAEFAEKRAADAALQAATTAAEPLSTPSTLERLRAHLDNALARLERDGLTQSQRDSLRDNPYLEAAHRGERIDTFVKETIANDENLAHLKITPRFQFGPDIYDDINKVWYDITTLKQWAAHEKKYTPGFGQGTPLFYGGK